MTLFFIIPGLLLALTGCSVLEPVKDLSTLHILDPLVPDRNLASGSPSIAVNRPSLPSYLDCQQLVTRSEGEIVLSKLDLWGEPLGAAIARVTASNLSRLTGSMNIQPVETFTSLDYTTLLELNIAQFEPNASNQMIFQGTWKMQPVNGRDSGAHFFRIEVPLTATTPLMKGRVTAMDQALERLARTIVNQ